MSQTKDRVQRMIQQYQSDGDFDEFYDQLMPLGTKEIDSLDAAVYSGAYTRAGYQDRVEFLTGKNKALQHLLCDKNEAAHAALKGNIENFIGMAQIPIGLAGPVWINGTHARGDFYIPMATTEGALVASYNRGMKACRLSGGVSTVCLAESIHRSPLFKFDRLASVGRFIVWIEKQFSHFQQIVSENSRYAQLIEFRTNVEGNSVILTFDFTTGDAAGQNMVTICTDRICHYILSNFDIVPTHWYIESNYSGDKKATALSFSNVRGKKVSAEVILSRTVVADVLKSTPEKIADYLHYSTLAVIQSGAIGAQGHVANGLAALFIACGQDVACVSESSIGLTRMEATPEGGLYAAVTLPSLAVGTIGGGTSLPTQNECLGLLDCVGVNKAKKFAEICGAVALAGELSIAAAMSVDHFTTAHQKLGRS